LSRPPNNHGRARFRTAIAISNLRRVFLLRTPGYTDLWWRGLSRLACDCLADAVRLRAVSLSFVLVCAGCAPLVRPAVAPSQALLSSEEQAVVAAIVTADIDLYRGEQPILLLDETSTWMPIAVDEPSVPDDFPRGDWLAQNPPVRDALRVANARTFSVGPSGVAARVTAFPRSRFEQMHRSRRGLRGLSKSFGGREPAVLEVSRPVIK
jgi:hypothetical protein